MAREIKVSIPAELPLDEMRRLVHGYCCNLKDRYGLAAQWAIHAPRFHDRSDGREVERRYRAGTIDQEEYLRILADPERTNLNFHAHILKSVREKDSDTGFFGEKIHSLDRGPGRSSEFRDMRGEWEIRTNAALQRVGSDARVDLRSNEEMAAAGDAPVGLVAQPHVGPQASHGAAPHYAGRVKARKETQEHNAEIWMAWEQRRALERERARLEASERIAAEREAARKVEAAAERRKIADAKTEQEARDAAREAVHSTSLRSGYEDVIAMAQRGEKMEMPEGQDVEIDPETYVREVSYTPFKKAIKVRRKAPVRVRTRSG